MRLAAAHPSRNNAKLRRSMPPKLFEPGGGFGVLRPQRTQYPLIKEYNLNLNIKAPYTLGYIP